MIIELSKEHKFFEVILSEDFEMEMFLQFIGALGEENAKKYLIVGSRLTNTDLTYKQRLDIGNFASERLNMTAKYTVIWPRKDINYFAISVMRLRGFNVQVFSNYLSGKDWLLS